MSSPLSRLFQVQGMRCGHCERSVMEAIKALDPDAQVHIDRPKERVEILSSLEQGLLVGAIRELGYSAALL